MKPYRLVMQAFGPYLRETAVDFTRLHGSGLFLITGSTGSGKTTILDAMCFALYGRATGTLRDARDMRSTAAPDDTDLRVAFEFGLGEARYRFERGVRQRLVKRRGGASERVPENYESCEEWDGEGWRLLCSGPQVREKAVELLGFSYEQFSQVVVLPQGEFRRLLTASSSEKQGILETLFGTSRWQAFTAALLQRSKSIAEELSACLAQDAALLEGAGCGDARALEEKLTSVRAESGAAAELAKRRGVASAAAQAALAAAKALAEQFAQLETYQKRQAELEARAGETERRRGELALAEKAEALLPYARAFAAARREAEAAAQALAACESGANRAEAEAEAARRARDAFAGADEKLRGLVEERAGLEKALEAARALEETARALEKARAKLAEAQKNAAALDTRAEKLAAELAARQARARALYDRCVAPMPALTEHKSLLAQQVQAAEKLRAQQKAAAETETSLAAKRAEYKQKAQEYRNERQTLERMQAALDADAAYRLSGSLEKGAPCPVCGSTEHPAPARAAADAPAPEELETQKGIVAALEEAVKKLTEEGYRLHGLDEAAQKALEELRAGAPSSADAETAAEALRDAERALSEAQRGAAERGRLEEEAQRLEAELKSVQEAAQTARRACEAAGAEASRLEGRAAELAAAVPESARGAGIQALETQIAALRGAYDDENARREAARARAEQKASARASAAAALAAARAADAGAKERLAAAQADFGARFAASGLPEGAKAEELALPPSRREELRAALAAYDRELAVQRDKTATLASQLAGRQRRDLAAAEAEAAAARAEAEQAAARRGALEAELKTLQGVGAQLARLAAREERLRGQYALYERLSALCRGDNPLKTPVHQFVLGLMLDDIVSCANTHLAGLSRGRYALRRAAAPGRGGGTKGLDLTVEDAWGGGERSVNTLSGGEMFLASLSLAFGLSDVVQSYAGGIRLDSLFIDEGFGSLDADTLDTAMDALERLRLSGRLIGVISHVGDLRSRIPARIEVSRLPDGTSSAEVTAG